MGNYGSSSYDGRHRMSARRSESFNCFGGSGSSSTSSASSVMKKRTLKQSTSCDTALRAEPSASLYNRLRTRLKVVGQKANEPAAISHSEVSSSTLDAEQAKFINDLNNRLISIKELNESPDPYEEVPAIKADDELDLDLDDDDYGFNSREINFIRVGKFAKSPALYDLKTFDHEPAVGERRLLLEQDENDDMLLKLDEYENLDTSSSACSSSSCGNDDDDDDTSITISTLSNVSNTITNASTSDTKRMVPAPAAPPKRTFRSLFMGRHFLLNKKKVKKAESAHRQQLETHEPVESSLKSAKKSLSDGLIYIDEENSYVLKSTSTSGCSSSSSRSSFSEPKPTPMPPQAAPVVSGLRRFLCGMNRKLVDAGRGLRTSRTTCTLASSEPRPLGQNCLAEISNTSRALEDRCLRDNISVYTLSYLNSPAPLAISENTTLSNSNDNLSLRPQPINTFDCFVIYP